MQNIILNSILDSAWGHQTSSSVLDMVRRLRGNIIMAKLTIVIRETRQRQERELQPGESLGIRRGESGSPSDSGRELGRVDSGDEQVLYVNSPHISQRHVLLRRNPDGQVMVKDLGSLNGTFLRLKPFQEYELPAD